MANLMEIAERVVNDPKYVMRDVTGDGVPETFCNIALNRIAKEAFNYAGFEGKMANAIYAMLKQGGAWKEVSGEEAAALARQNAFVVAAQPAKTHGHVAVVVPKPMVMSGKWKKMVPTCANVGKKNGIMGINHAFGDEPEYFALT